jgi:hypothetical protein
LDVPEVTNVTLLEWAHQEVVSILSHLEPSFVAFQSLVKTFIAFCSPDQEWT